MHVQEHIELLLGSNSKAAMIAAASGIERPVVSKPELKELVDLLQGYMMANRRRVATATTLSLALADADGMVGRLRRLGCLRASRYDFREGCVSEVVELIRDSGQLRRDRLTYLESVLALHSLSPEVRRLREGLLVRLRPRRKWALKTLLAVINQLFANGWEGSKHESPMSLAHYGAEELAEAFSTIVDLFEREYGLEMDQWRHVDQQVLRPKSSIYGDLLIDAARINAFKRAETLVDGLPYCANQIGTSVTISSVEMDLEKSVRLGYVQMEQQVALRRHALYKEKAEGNGPPSLQDLVQKHFDAGLSDMVQLETKPRRRLVFKMIAHPTFFEPLSANHLFLEDVLALLALSVDDYDDDVFKVTEVSKYVSSMDILKVQRLFGFTSFVYKTKLATISDGDERDELMLRSVIPLFRRDQILHLLGMVLPDGNAEEVLTLLTLDGSRGYVDLQYTPFIRMGDLYVVAPALLANSNLVRNVICHRSLRSSLVGVADPMQQAVVRALETAGFKVRSGHIVNVSGKALEVDILAWRDGVLFIFECKNAYHPCTTHEMRNSFEHIETGREQLDIRLEWLRDQDHQATLFSILGWHIAPTNEICTGIVIANRVFNGSKQGEHPVRQAHELINVVSRGQIRSTEGTFSFWQGTTFQTTDLVAYLKGDTLICEQFASLQPIANQIPFGSRSLAFETYFMDMRQLADQIRCRYKLLPASNRDDQLSKSDGGGGAVN